MSERTRTVEEVMKKEDFEKIVALYYAYKNAELDAVKDALHTIMWELRSKYCLGTSEWIEFRKNEYFDCINVYIADQEAERKSILRQLGYQA
ncbi:MAG TPA: hypothetical protein DEQ26_09075 [Flavobacteriaceae bacterium]|nr:hypothetical protein [Flavobacteriaceae bacterium]